MKSNSWTILCLAYVIGLSSHLFFLFHWLEIIVLLISISAIAAIIGPRFYFVSAKIFLLAGLIAILAVFYYQWRSPQLTSTNIAGEIPFLEGLVKIRGEIVETPKLTRNLKVQFVLHGKELELVGNSKIETKTLTGNIYATVPLLQGTGLSAGDDVSVVGLLSSPRSALNPGSFDFENYLASQNIFTFCNGSEVVVNYSENLRFGERLRERIVRSQVRWLGSPEGLLLSSMVLGKNALDLPYDLRDSFVKVGLAHVLAASGFQVSLLLGWAIIVTKRFSSFWRLTIPLSFLLIYLILTGIEASVLRAVVMASATLIGSLLERQVRPIGSLLLSATILLIFNPLWIGDLGFQLSFLSTFGLIVTAPIIDDKLDWIPSTIAVSISIPLSASIWTLPLSIYVFYIISVSSIFVNIIVTPLITIISLWGAIASAIGALVPILGSALSWLLLPFLKLLILIVNFFVDLPGSSYALGQISFGLLCIVYFAFIAIWLNKWCQKYWQWIAIFVLAAIGISIVGDRWQISQITVLAVAPEQAIVIQERDRVTLIVNNLEKDRDRHVILPFLASKGINDINDAIILDLPENIDKNFSYIWQDIRVENLWSNLSPQILGERIDGYKFQQLGLNKKNTLSNIGVELVNLDPLALKFNFQGQNWLILGKNKENKLKQLPDSVRSEILIWTGKGLNKKWLKVLQPKVAIASSNNVNKQLKAQLKQNKIELYITGRDGAIFVKKPKIQTYLQKDFEEIK